MLFIKRLILFLIAVAIIITAITMSGLNTEKVLLNLYFFEFELSLGFLVILTLFTGLVTGLLMALFGFYVPLKSEIRKLTRSNRMLIAEKRLEAKDD